MEEVRKFHNDVKRELIQFVVRDGDHVLDVGCGAGGDTHKWKHAKCHVDMCDPDPDAVKEAKVRSRKHIFCCDVRGCPSGPYDVVCYNFSIQYIFESQKLFQESVAAICQRLKTGGCVIGCVPNSDMILLYPSFRDALGNFMVRRTDKTGHGGFGEKVQVQLVDTPYYKNGPRPEYIAYKDLLVAEFHKHGVELEHWGPFVPHFEISRMYAYFIFKCYR